MPKSKQIIFFQKLWWKEVRIQEKTKECDYELGLRFKGCTSKSFVCSWMETGGQSDILGYVDFNLDKPQSINAMSLKVFRIIQIEL